MSSVEWKSFVFTKPTRQIHPPFVPVLKSRRRLRQTVVSIIFRLIWGDESVILQIVGIWRV